MKKLLTELLNTIFPPRAGQIIVRHIQTKRMLDQIKSKAFDGTIYLFDYKNSDIKNLITENKYHNNAQASRILGQLLLHWIEHDNKRTLVVPIPLGPRRQRERGYNQVQNVIDQSGVACTKLLRRVVNTPPQTELERNQRIQNIKNAFVFQHQKIDWHQYDQVVILDDVVTTGATIKEARTTLAPHLPSHIKITCLAIAH